MATNPREIGPLTLMIAKEVKLQRISADILQEDLSQRADIKRPTLSKIERGVVTIDTEQIDRLAQAFGMLPEEFIASARRHEKERLAVRQPDPEVGPLLTPRGSVMGRSSHEEHEAVERWAGSRPARGPNTPNRGPAPAATRDQ